ncbi:MAG TPA: AAA family ATPase [Burkholderiaceae bacterium]|nr:AAA family ATPase [Burkholderiaceae bacterium]
MKINEVFTPRTSAVNLKTYVPRVSLEVALSRSIQGSMHSILFGESGNGKSWLYKKVFAQMGFHYKVANCANASRINSVSEEIYSALMPRGKVTKIGFDEIKEASVKAIVADGKLSNNTHYKVDKIDPLYESMSSFRSQIGTGDAIVVLENLEAIFEQPNLMDELGNILLLLDDPVFGEFNIKFLIVGVPNGILEYFAKTKNIESVANRLEELPKVGSLTKPMVGTLVEKGFNELLHMGLTAAELNEISTHVHHRTLGVAQRVQEYCERLAYEIEDSKAGYTFSCLEESDKKWLSIGLRQAYTVIESHLNSKQTTIARRNQAIYCIGHMNSHQIDALSIVEMIKTEFPNTAKETNMGLAAILAELASTDSPLLRKNPKTKEYRIVDPRYLMCIRVMLYKNSTDYSIEKRFFKL